MRVLLFILMLSLTACDSSEQVIDPGTNRGETLLVRDIVLLTSPPAVIAFSQITAQDWIDNRASIVETWGSMIEVRQFRIQPGARGEAFGIKSANYRAGVMFSYGDGNPRKTSLKID